MLGSRMAMEKLTAMDARYAKTIGNLLRDRQGGQVVMASNPYVAGMVSPAGSVQAVREQIRQADIPQSRRDQELRQVLAMELGVAGRYGIPAAALGGAAAFPMALSAGNQPVSQSAPAEIDYNTPAHGSRLSPESHAIYKEIHQGLMNGTVSSEELRSAVGSGQFDHDPLLVAHFMDVMG